MLMKYGVYSTGILLLCVMLMYFFGVSMSMLQNLMLLILGAEMFFCCQEYKQRSQQTLSYRQAFGLSWQVSIFTGITMGFLFLVLTVVSGPQEMLNTTMQNKQLIQQTGESAENIEVLLRLLLTPWFLFLFTTFIYAFFGFFLSFIVAFLARTPQLPTQNES